MNKEVQKSNSERGGAGLKMVIALVVVGLAAHAALNYIPVAYDAGSFKQEMDTQVVNALALPGNLKPLDVVKNRLTKSIKDSNLPLDTVLEVKPAGSVIQARAVFTKQVAILPFGMWDYAYHFDYTAIPQGFLAKETSR